MSSRDMFIYEKNYLQLYLQPLGVNYICNFCPKTIFATFLLYLQLSAIYATFFLYLQLFFYICNFFAIFVFSAIFVFKYSKNRHFLNTLLYLFFAIYIYNSRNLYLQLFCYICIFLLYLHIFCYICIFFFKKKILKN